MLSPIERREYSMCSVPGLHVDFEQTESKNIHLHARRKSHRITLLKSPVSPIQEFYIRYVKMNLENIEPHIIARQNDRRLQHSLLHSTRSHLSVAMRFSPRVSHTLFQFLAFHSESCTRAGATHSNSPPRQPYRHTESTRCKVCPDSTHH
jgi:hypothetical protein